MSKDQEMVFTQQSLRALVGSMKSKLDDLAVLARIESAALLDNNGGLETRVSSYAF